MYQIVQITPAYCEQTSAIIGSRIASRSHGYHTAALALKLASVLSIREEAKGYSDDFYAVVPFGQGLRNRIRPAVQPVSDEELPF